MPLTTKKLGFSKYDFVKVRVYLSPEHYYVLSRFLTCRVLTAAKVSCGWVVRGGVSFVGILPSSSSVALLHDRTRTRTHPP